MERERERMKKPKDAHVCTRRAHAHTHIYEFMYMYYRRIRGSEMHRRIYMLGKRSKKVIDGLKKKNEIYFS